MADGFGVGVRADGLVEPASSVKTVCLASHGQTPLAEFFLEKLGLQSCKITDEANPERVQILLRNFADPRDLADIKGRKETRLLPGNHQKIP